MDNYAMWERNEARLERELARRPVCAYCDEHIQDEQFYCINGEYICIDCMENNFKVNTEDYLE